MRILKKFIGFLAVALLVTVGVAQQQADAITIAPSFSISYDISLDANATGNRSIEPVVSFQRTNDQCCVIWPFKVDPGSSTLTVTNSIANPPTVPVTGTFLLGLLDGLPGDGANPVPHLVLFMNSAVDGTTEFTTLFPTTSEDVLIKALKEVFAATADPSVDQILAAVKTVSDFANGDGAKAGVEFDAAGGSFNIFAFSGGTLIGSGTTQGGPAGAPAPGSLALLGLALIGLAAVRKKHA